MNHAVWTKGLINLQKGKVCDKLPNVKKGHRKLFI